MKYYSVRTRVLVPLFIVLSSLLATFAWTLHRFGVHHVRESVRYKFRSVEHLLEEHFERDALMMASTLEVITRNEVVSAALQRNDKLALRDYAEPIFKRLKLGYGISSFSLINAEKICIFCAQDPGISACSNRPSATLTRAASTRALTTGLEVGPLATALTFRVVKPSYFGGKLAGFVELGEEINNIADRLHYTLDVEVLIVGKKKFLHRDSWEERLAKSGSTWDEFSELVILHETKDSLHKDPKMFDPGWCSPNTSIKSGPILDGVLGAHAVIPLKSIEGQTLGFLVVSADIANFVLKERILAGLVLLACFGLGAILFGFFCTFMGRVEQDIARTNRELIRIGTAVDCAGNAVLVANSSGKIEYQNEAGHRLFGYTVDEINQVGGPEALLEDLSLENDVVKAISVGQAWSGEVNVRTRLGESVPVWFRSDAVKDESGKILGRVAIYADIRRRKRAEAELLKSQSKLRQLTSRLYLAEESERRRIAVDVHDRIAQHLAFAKMKATELRAMDVPGAAKGIAERIIGLLNETIQETRTLISDLGSPVFHELGFMPAIESLARRIEAEHGLAVIFKDDAMSKPISDDVAVFLLQATRELLVNVVKHAAATEARVHIRRTDSCVQLEVQDNGVGFESEKAKSRLHATGGFGLFSIQERLELIGGSMTISRVAAGGSAVSLVVPIQIEQDGKEGRGIAS